MRPFEPTGTVKEWYDGFTFGSHTDIKCPIDEQIVYNQLDDNETAIWSLLLASGYLKVLDYQLPIETDGMEMHRPCIG